MKQFKIRLLVLSFAFCGVASAQSVRADTSPVWIVYLDSVKLFNAYPDVEMRLEVAAGWEVQTQKGKTDYYDLDGVIFNKDVILTRPRKIKPNPFRQ